MRFLLCVLLAVYQPTNPHPQEKNKTKANKKRPKLEDNMAQRSPFSLALFRNNSIYPQRIHNSRFRLLSTVEKRYFPTYFFQLPAVTEMHWSLRLERGPMDRFSTCVKWPHISTARPCCCPSSLQKQPVHYVISQTAYPAPSPYNKKNPKQQKHLKSGKWAQKPPFLSLF